MAGPLLIHGCLFTAHILIARFLQKLMLQILGVLVYLLITAVFWWPRSAAKYNTPGGGTYGNTWLFAITDDQGNPLRVEANFNPYENASTNYGVFISIYHIFGSNTYASNENTHCKHI